MDGGFELDSREAVSGREDQGHSPWMWLSISLSLSLLFSAYVCLGAQVSIARSETGELWPQSVVLSPLVLPGRPRAAESSLAGLI